MDAEFLARAARARRPALSPDCWSGPAADWVRMAIFAGFDAKELIIRCLRSSSGARVNIRTVERVLDEINKENR